MYDSSVWPTHFQDLIRHWSKDKTTSHWSSIGPSQTYYEMIQMFAYYGQKASNTLRGKTILQGLAKVVFFITNYHEGRFFNLKFNIQKLLFMSLRLGNALWKQLQQSQQAQESTAAHNFIFFILNTLFFFLFTTRVSSQLLLKYLRKRKMGFKLNFRVLTPILIVFREATYQISDSYVAPILT